MTNPHDILGVTADASGIVIEAAYRALVKEHHPDQGGSKEQFKEIQDAYEQLQDGETPSRNNGDTGAFSGFAEGLAALGSPVRSESIEGTLDDDLTIEQAPLRVSLLGVFKTDIEELVWDHRIDSVETQNRTLCLFKIENTSEYVQSWRGSNDTKFTGTDGQTYLPADPTTLAATSNSTLPSQFNINLVDLEPKSWTLGVVAVEALAEGVNIQRVSYTHSVFDEHQTDGVVREKIRFDFTITPAKRQQMLSLIAQELMNEPPTDTRLAAIESSSSLVKGNQVGNTTEAGDTNMKSEGEDPSTGTERKIASGRSGKGPTEVEQQRINDIIRLAPTSNGELASEWNLNSGKKAYHFISDNLDEYFRRDEQSLIVPTEAVIQLVDVEDR